MKSEVSVESWMFCFMKALQWLQMVLQATVGMTEMIMYCIFFILADGKKMRAHVGKEEKRIFSGGFFSFWFHNICLFGVFFSLWRHPWAILWSYEAVWSGRITSYNTVPVPWWLCWPWLLQYWGKSKRILLRMPHRNPNRKKNITSNIFLVLVSTVCFIPLVAENPLSKDTIFTSWKSWM